MYKISLILILIFSGFICYAKEVAERDGTFELSLLAAYPSAGVEGKYFFTDSFGLGFSPTLSWDKNIDFQVSLRPIILIDLLMLKKNTPLYINTGFSVDFAFITKENSKVFNVGTSLPIGIGITEPTKRFSVEFMITPGVYLKPETQFHIKAGIIFSYRFGGHSRSKYCNIKCPVITPVIPEKNVTENSNKVSTELTKQINELKKQIKNPLLGRVSSRFGMRHHPIKKKPTFHQGIDISAPKGKPIIAAIGGKIAFSGNKKGYGNLVIIQNDIYETRYAHCDTLNVKTGAAVKSGVQIATVGSTGDSTGPHLHFETRINNNPIDPEMFLTWE